ncbi:DEAD-box ATP-dependent RNA helicase 57 isoform X3 [Rhodamnia argentea]|uniref:RNA helicase n=1 Tax=Rhodamnia argentea TaxID=178133 RepID=A0A8B8Q0S1_9MYRT|nr:DEAD-box ATP-dependent RNA helicase 57 isoform X3 [Rhodamnia argentea]
MERDPLFLFAGIHFNRKKFAGDFARFRDNKERIDLVENSSLLETSAVEREEATVPAKKRKRKAVSASGTVEGFSVFKSSKSAPTSVVELKETDEDGHLKGRKEMYRQMERDAILRKKHNVHVSGSNVPSPLQDFAELRTRFKCKSYLLRNIAELGFKEPTPIQRQAIPVLLSGRECFACAPTGSGKTLAFVCPMLMKLKHASKEGIRAVILCPTKELAAQTTRECRKLARGNKFRIKLMTKALVTNPDLSKLRCDILISTPLRLRLAIKNRKMNLSRVEYLVLDESDKLFELGLVKQIDFVVKACSNPSIVRSLFSATLPDYVEELARTIMHDAIRVIVGIRLLNRLNKSWSLLGVKKGSFLHCVRVLLSKERAKELYGELALDNIRASVIHSDLSQVQRENAVDDFRAGKTWVLIATDVIARGMDFKGVNCVINYDFPDSAAAYIHRIGRSGRAGRSGEAITFYTEDDIPYLRNIANVMTASGCEVPSWIMALTKTKWKKHRPKRESISTKPKDEIA